MKNKFFSFKLIVIIFIALFSLALIYLSAPKKHEAKEVTKEIKIHHNAH